MAATLAGVVIGLVVGYIPSLLVWALVASLTQGAWAAAHIIAMEGTRR